MKVAVLGAGAMGQSVIENLRSNPQVNCVVAYDVRTEPLRQVGIRFGIEATEDLERILCDREIRLVFITASNDAHFPLACRALEAGKAVFCEKPMAIRLEDAATMVARAEEHQAFLQIGFECRYSKLYAKVRQWIDRGLLGDVINTHCSYICSEFHGKGSWRNQLATGGGLFGEKLSHYVDLSRWWIGSPVRELISMCAPNVIPYFQVRDNYHTTFRFENGAVAHLTFMMAVAATFGGDPLQNPIDQQRGDGHELRYVIEGTRGAAETDVFGRHIKRWEFGDSPASMTSTWVEDLSWDASEDHAYFHNTTDQTADIVRRVAADEGPFTVARDSYETMKVCFAAERSADEGRLVSLDELEP